MNEVVADVAARLCRAGVPALLTDGPGHPPWPDIDILVPRNRWRTARAVLAGADWRHELGGLGIWRVTGTVSYGWDDGT
ncbi:MAG: hypothetical protein ACRD0S_08285, partial [Acidimicrobiales bacterium]